MIFIFIVIFFLNVCIIRKLKLQKYYLYFVYGKHRLQVLNTAVHSKIVTYDELWLSFYVLCDLVSSHLEIPFSDYSYNLPSCVRRHVQEMIFKYLAVKPEFLYNELREISTPLSLSVKIRMYTYLSSIQSILSEFQKCKQIRRSDYEISGSGLKPSLFADPKFINITYNEYVTDRQSLIITIQGPRHAFGGISVPSINHQVSNHDDTLGKSFKFTTQKVSDKVLRVQYTVEDDGLYEISVISKGVHLNNSPYKVRIVMEGEKIVTKMVRFWTAKLKDDNRFRKDVKCNGFQSCFPNKENNEDNTVEIIRYRHMSKINRSSIERKIQKCKEFF